MDSSLLLSPLIAFPFLAVSSSFSRLSRVSSARWCYFRASVLCKCRMLALRCRFRYRADSIGQVVISCSLRNIRRGYRPCPVQLTLCSDIFCCERFIYVCVQVQKIVRLLGAIVFNDRYKYQEFKV